MPRVTIHLDDPIEGWENMSTMEREKAVGEEMEKAMDKLADHFDVIVIDTTDSFADTIILDTDLDRIVVEGLGKGGD